MLYRITFLIGLIVLLLSNYSQAQTTVFHENFEPASYADSVTSIPTAKWTTTNTLSVSGSYADSCTLLANDSIELITNTFSTQGHAFVMLQFQHICKIEFFDHAYVFVSVDNGVTWTQLTFAHYMGQGQFGIIGNKFSSTAYPFDWDPAIPNSQPNNSWWKKEYFDISSIASNSTQVKVKFVLEDGNGTGAAGNYGWLLDDIKVIGALSELFPPVISQNAPIWQDSVYQLGPFDVHASISDASGIDTAILIYSVNGQANDSVPMQHTFGNQYVGLIDTLPPFQIGDTICYHIYAKDASLEANESVYPGNACAEFYLKSSPPPPSCTQAIDSFPFFTDFEQGFSIGAGTPYNPGILDSTWSRTPLGGTSQYMWVVHSGSTGSTATGPSGDHTSGLGTYLYAEASNGSSGDTAILMMPCIDIHNIAYPVLEFYFHMYGNTMGELHVDAYFGGAWVNDIMPPLQNDSGDVWHKTSVGLNLYKGITQIRFRAIKGSSYGSDIAIDDIRIWQPPAYDAGVISIDQPHSPSASGQHDIKASIRNFGSEVLNKVSIEWELNGVSQPTNVWTGILGPGLTADSILIGSYNFPNGPAIIKAWTSLPNDSVDGFAGNDTTSYNLIACSGPFRGTFSIGGVNADFTTFNDALFAISNCGIDSAIVFDVNPGTYIEQLLLDTIPGASESNTITFRSANGDSSTVILQYSSTNPQANYVIKFNDADYFRFENMTIEATSSNYAYVCVFEFEASHNAIENCVLNMPPGYNYYASAFYSTSNSSHHNRIENNRINNGYHALRFQGVSSTAKSRGNQIIDNTFIGFTYYGAYLQYQDSIIVRGNYFQNMDSSSYSCYPIYLYYGGDGFRVEQNEIKANSSSSLYGIRIYFSDATNAAKGLVANNMINLYGTTSYPYGIYNYSSDYVNFYNNTVCLNTFVSANSRCFYNASSANVNLVNNILVNLAEGYTVYMSSGSINQSDYNIMYTNGPTFAYWSGPRTTFAALKAYTNQESSSASFIPNFVSLNDAHLIDGSLNGLGLAMPQIVYDVDGELRDTLAPAIGADEKPPIPIDAGVADIISPQNLESEAQMVPVKVLVKNYGIDTLLSFTCGYQLNGQAIQSQQYNGVLSAGSIDTVVFAAIPMPPGPNQICAFTTLSTDTNFYNDTLCKSFYATPIIDLGVVEVLSPDSGMCYVGNQELKVKIENFGLQALDMSVHPVTISAIVDGPSQVFIQDYVINTGTLAVGAQQDIVLSTTMDIDHTGLWDFKIWTAVGGDGDAFNDTLKDYKIMHYQTIKQYPYIADFESSLASGAPQDPGQIMNGWAYDSQNSAEMFQWYVGQGATHTNNTGPTTDHTVQGTQGKYLYSEAVGSSAGSAYLTSPCFDFTGMNAPAMRFWYHCFGDNIHSLRVDVLSNGSWHYSIGHIIGETHAASTDPWQQAVIDLSSFAGEIVKIRFRAIKYSGIEADMAIDDIFVYDPVPKDVGIASHFELPRNTFSPVNTLDTIKVKIVNYGTDTITQMTVGYMAANGAPIIEQWNGLLLPYGHVEYQFNNLYAVQAGEQSICAFTELQNDGNASNDTSCIDYTGVPIISLPYYDDFEGANFFVSDGGLQQWERGSPSKLIHDHAHSGNTAWLTNLAHQYSPNSNDYLYTPYFDFSQVQNTYLRFYHRYDMDENGDGGSIQFSTDGGSTWLVLGYISDPNAQNWYNINNGGTHMWSGPDSGWVYSHYNLSQFNGFSNPVQFRFHMFSDYNSNVGDGWMIDDFVISPNQIQYDGGVAELANPVKYPTIGTTVYPVVKIRNHGYDTIANFTVSYQVDNNPVVSETVNVSIPPSDVYNFTFQTGYLSSAAYQLKVFTSITGDSYYFNDTSSVHVIKDVGISQIVLPSQEQDFGDSVLVKVRIENYGFDTITSIALVYSVAGSVAPVETWTGVLAPSSFDFYTFTTPMFVQLGAANVCASTQLSNDANPSNNDDCKVVIGYVSLQDVDPSAFTLGQNEPNPATNITTVPFSLPKAGVVTLRVYDISGRIIEERTMSANAGENLLKINVDGFKSGLYFYSLEFDKVQQHRKMVISN
jgi:hypothetical protein